MKTKKFFMTSLLVMGMIIAKAANGFPPELVLVSQPVLTYDANSVTVYYDLQNIGDYSYKGDIYLYLDPDNGYYYAKKYVRICPGRIKRVSITIPAYRPNPSWTYTVMPYYELGDDLYSFTTFEYFEPLRFCWYGYHSEPWVVVHIGPRIHAYTRPGDYRYYYDGYRPMIPPPPPGGYAPGHGPGPHAMPPMNPMHHTYGYHHSNGGYPANHHPEGHVPGYNPVAPNHDGPGHDGPGHNGNPGHNGGNNPGNNGGATVVPNGSNTPGSTSTNSAGNNGGANTSNGNNSGATTRPNSNVNSGSNTNNSGATSRPSGNTNNNGSTSRPSGNTNNSGNVSRPSGNTNNSGNTSRPSNNSGNVSRPSSNTNNSGTTNSGRSGNSSSSSSRNSSSSNSSNSSNNSNSSSSSGSSRGGNNTTPTRSR